MAKIPFKQPDKKDMKRAGIRFGIMLAAILVMLVLAWVLTGVIQRRGGGPDIDVPVSSATPPESQASLPGQGSEPGVGPTQQDPDDMSLTAPDYRMIALPENGRVDMSYFGTATFLGDSLTQGLAGWSGIEGATFCAYKGISIRAVTDGSLHANPAGEMTTILEEIVNSQPDNLYIQLGANNMVNTSDENIVIQYRDMIRALRESLAEGVGIYIQSITPVRPENNANFDMERIHSLNNMLAQMAWEEDVYFLDLNEVLMDAEGFLNEEYAAGDGYHMQPIGYAAWKEYLITHTAYHPRNPYLPGSPYYREE